jgi:hypothetical protein
MQENSLTYWMNLDDEEFIHQCRYINYGVLSRLDVGYIQSRLKELGYEIDFGCCGRNSLRSFKYE